MISIVGIGNGASAIAEKFASNSSNYNAYSLNTKVAKRTKYKFKLKTFSSPEEYEKNIPDVKKFFKEIDEHVQVFVLGSSYSSNYTLGILEQIKHKKLDVFYIQPDIELISGIPKLVEQACFGVLQEYARSGLLNSLTLISNCKMEDALVNVPVKSYFDVINSSVFSTVHYLNYFNHAEPEIGNVSKPNKINRLRTIGLLNMENFQEKWLFDLDTPRELCYYLCINKEKLETEGGLHRKIVDLLKKKPTNAYCKLSYAIYETEHKRDFGFCVAHTNVIQSKKPLTS